MCHERRQPQTATSAAISQGSHPPPEPVTSAAQTTEMTVSPTPQVTSTTQTRS